MSKENPSFVTSLTFFAAVVALIRCFTHTFCSASALLLIAGCGGPGSTQTQREHPATQTDPSNLKNDDHAARNDVGPKEGDANHGHSHERGKMLMTDAGPIHALLTAHLAAAGNELDIFLETPDTKKPQPVAIDAKSFEAQATTGEGESQTLIFEPAPPEERPAGEAAGKCSHFVAKAPWMKPEDDLLVVAKFPARGATIVGRWKNFNPRKYAHHDESLESAVP